MYVYHDADVRVGGVWPPLAGSSPISPAGVYVMIIIMPSKMEVASQHWTDWTDWTVETIEINRKI